MKYYLQVNQKSWPSLKYFMSTVLSGRCIKAMHRLFFVIFPNNLIAGMFGFSKMAFFEVENAAERNAPQVKF